MAGSQREATIPTNDRIYVRTRKTILRFNLMQVLTHYHLSGPDIDPIVSVEHPRGCAEQTRFVAVSAGVTLHGQLISCDQALLEQAAQDPIGRADLNPALDSDLSQKERLIGVQQRCHDSVLHGLFVQPNAKIR